MLAGLLVRVAQGDREAFTAFYELTSHRVYGLARRIVVDPGMAEDSAQEIFLIVWKDAHKYSPTLGSPMTWLMTITHRKAVDKVRLEQNGSNREARWGAANHSPGYDVVAETVTGRIEAETVLQCLNTLSPRQREAIDLAYYNCLTYREVAERLSAPLPTIKARIRAGLQRIQTCLGEA
ncbi:ECF RNA polymerase sigma factor SigK [Arthrobacter sp. EH-1B-1]|uniref:ECF RNA polymerase sigma factor SigK n=1 Tax=Arthrobacter vasquezii TaxID=2977629 RepID=A0ABT6CXT4_9MICC|nr:ECF RNA polymerase sigma factor SigK [Arthrobacter vasquezii]